MKIKNENKILILIVFICLICIYIYNLYYTGKTAIALIYYKSEIVKSIDLKPGADKIFSVEQNKDVVFHLFNDGSISFIESDCPDKICIKTGKIKRIGESAACLPNDLVIKIVPKGKYEDDYHDIIIGR